MKNYTYDQIVQICKANKFKNDVKLERFGERQERWRRKTVYKIIKKLNKEILKLAKQSRTYLNIIIDTPINSEQAVTIEKYFVNQGYTAQINPRAWIHGTDVYINWEERDEEN